MTQATSVERHIDKVDNFVPHFRLYEKTGWQVYIGNMKGKHGTAIWAYYDESAGKLDFVDDSGNHMDSMRDKHLILGINLPDGLPFRAFGIHSPKNHEFYKNAIVYMVKRKAAGLPIQLANWLRCYVLTDGPTIIRRMPSQVPEATNDRTKGLHIHLGRPAIGNGAPTTANPFYATYQQPAEYGGRTLTPAENVVSFEATLLKQFQIRKHVVDTYNDMHTSLNMKVQDPAAKAKLMEANDGYRTHLALVFDLDAESRENTRLRKRVADLENEVERSKRSKND